MLDDDATVDQVDTDNVPTEDYNTQGRTTVATPRGYRFAPNNKDIPVITSVGVKVTAEQAETLVDESKGLVAVVPGQED